MDHSPLPFKNLGPLLGLLAVVVGLSLADLSYLNTNSLATVIVSPSTPPVITTKPPATPTPTYPTPTPTPTPVPTVPTPVVPLAIQTFDLRFDATQYPFKPSLHFVVVGPSNISVAQQNNLCTLSDGTYSNQPVSVRLNDFSGMNYRPVFGTNLTTRTMTLTCSYKDPVTAKTTTVYKSLYYPPDESKGSGDFGATSLISSFTITPTGRPVSTNGTLAWQASVNSNCVLIKGSTSKTVNTNSSGEGTTYLTVPATSPATTYTLTCVDNKNNNSRSTKVIIDTPSSAPAPVAPTITSFTATPNPRHYNEAITLAWTTSGMKTCSLVSPSGDMISNSTGALNSSSVALNLRTIKALSSIPSFLGPYPYTLSCSDGKTTYSKKIDINTIAAVTPPVTPPTPGDVYASGVHEVTFGTDLYSSYNVPTRQPDRNLSRVRLAQKVPIFSSSNKNVVYGGENLFDNFFHLLTAAALNSDPVSVDIFKDGVANYWYRPILKVPYWTKVKFQWRFAERSQNDATPDSLGPTNLPEGNWCGYVKYTQKECQKKFPDTKSKEYDTCLHQRIAWPPQAIAFSNYDKNSKTYSGWQMLYDGGFMSCKDQYPSGEWEWTPTPEDPTKTVMVESQIWSPSGTQNEPLNLTPKWLPEMSDSGTQRYTTVQGYKCELPFDKIVDSLNILSQTNITENNFRDWATDDAVDWFGNNPKGTEQAPVEPYMDCAKSSYGLANPTMCGSGDLEDIKFTMKRTQTCTAIPSLVATSQLFNYTNLDKYAYYSDNNYPFNIDYALVKQDGDNYQLDGFHSVIALKMTRSGSGSSAAYVFDILDPNGPSNYSLNCSPVFGKIESRSVRFLVCTADRYKGELITLFNREANISSPNLDTMVNNRVRDGVSDWLKANYPKINNNASWTKNGICAGWTDFVLRVAYLGRFVGECPKPPEK